ncbi:acyl-CoA dehydrogenase [Rhodococcus sp. D2-41]|uniref:Acyl-CoA/acyl-ACP dehydrogenase n=1 Tax=Speluncibacter jeojiensis TaxID=2710754 RepID=A0A9X4M312_9ACTN|nr:acyl-CoA dehydrogenase family protein [Rhodococcus sp. D2-41]MDG3011467.1 acyl-CoA dehydrogenase [Rhodococcus sp. D2-41]MDG3015177.1 acyl-CoA/acyl-ACP dehydrogenase [Corynebacteriales bacterium D3-21]
MATIEEGGLLTEEQRALADTVRNLVGKRADSAAVRAAAESERGYDESLWQVLCEQIGVAALAIPEEFGGIGAGAMETHLVLEELGRALVPSPMLGSVVLGAQALLASGNTEACERLLPGVAEGATTLALCWGNWEVTDLPVRAGADGALTGRADYVLGGEIADVLLVAAQTADGPALFEVDPAAAGVSRERVGTMDPTRPLATVTFDSTPARRLTEGDGAAVLERVRDLAVIALSAEQVGAAAQILEKTVEYTKARKQFGRVIGSFQALKHRMADLYVEVETARSMSYSAALSLSPAEAGLAKVYCSEAFEEVAGDAIQLHGGIAITWEHDAHLYFKRAHGSSQLFGQPRRYLTELATAAGLP